MKAAEKPFVLGITGNIGSGKSTVAQLWSRYNCHIIEGDKLGREVVEHSPEYRIWLRQHFGPAIFHGDTLDRAALGRIVFADKQARDAMNAAIWPFIRARLEAAITDTLNSGRIALVDAAMIFEWGDEARYDVLVAVIADPHEAARRAAARMNLSPGEMLQRYNMQLPAQEKSRRSDFTIRNDGSLETLRAKAFGLWPHVSRRAHSRATQHN